MNYNEMKFSQEKPISGTFGEVWLDGEYVAECKALQAKLDFDKEKITMSLKDFLYIRRVLEEYMRYLHNPDHYPDIEAIQNFLGDISSGGGFECLSTAIYKKVYKVDLPSKIEKMIDDGVFEHPLYPSYYKENE